MSNQQLYFAIGLPCLTIIVSLILNQIAVSGIWKSIETIQGDVREIRSDIKLLTGKVYELMGEKH